MGGFRDIEFLCRAGLAPEEGDDEQPAQQTAKQDGSQRRQGSVGHHGADDQQADQHHQAGNHDHQGGEFFHGGVALAMPGVYHRRGGAGNHAAEKAEQRRAIAAADDVQCRIARQAEPRYQDDHQPRLVRIECVVRAEILIWQNRQDDEGQHRKLQYGDQVAARQPLRQAAQLRLEIEQGGDADRQHDGEPGKFVPDHCAQPVTQQQGDYRGGARVVLFDGSVEIGGDDRGGYREQPCEQYPRGIEFVGEQGGQRAEHGDQRKGAQPGLGRRVALALQADQQADGKAGEKLRQRLYPVSLQEIEVHVYASCQYRIINCRLWLPLYSLTSRLYTACICSGSGSLCPNSMASMSFPCVFKRSLRCFSPTTRWLCTMKSLLNCGAGKPCPHTCSSNKRATSRFISADSSVPSVSMRCAKSLALSSSLETCSKAAAKSAKSVSAMLRPAAAAWPPNFLIKAGWRLLIRSSASRRCSPAMERPEPLISPSLARAKAIAGR